MNGGEGVGLGTEDLNRVPRVITALHAALFLSDERGCGCVQVALSDVYRREPGCALLLDAFGCVSFDRIGAELLDVNRTIGALLGVLNRVDPTAQRRAIRQYLNEQDGARHGCG